ncbi:MAG: hypothetical protein WD000_01600 [Thermodesulfobacteriota bacterium]
MLTNKQKQVAIDLATGMIQKESARKRKLHYMTITLWKRQSDFLMEVERLKTEFRNSVIKTTSYDD